MGKLKEQQVAHIETMHEVLKWTLCLQWFVEYCHFSKCFGPIMAEMGVLYRLLHIKNVG